MKICGKCKISKEDNCFNNSQFKSTYGLCFICLKEYKKNYYILNKEKIINKYNDSYEKNRDKYINYQKKRRQNRDEFSKKKDSEYQKKYYLNNKEERLLKNKKWRENNIEKVIKSQRNYFNDKMKNDIIFRMKKKISFQIFNYLKNKNINKNNKSILNYLPYTISELKTHIESLFEPWMNWDNQGNYILKEWRDEDQSTWKWQLDHIIPHSKFNYTSMEDEEFKKCWALENLRPYPAKQNVIDGNRR